MRKNLFVITVLASVLVAGIFVYKLPKRQAATNSPSPATQSEGDALHPMMIEAMRQRDYPGGEIKVERVVSSNAAYSTQIISYPSDGLKIYALANVPTGQPPNGGWPVILLLHGYINPDSYETLGGDYRYWLDGLSRQGYVVVKPDLRGHGQSEGEPESGQWSPVYTYDALNLIASLKTYPISNPDKVGLAGHSMGGTIALRAIVTKQNVKSAAILAGAVGSAHDLYYNWTRTDRQSPPPQNIISTRRQLVDAYGEPKNNPDFWNKTSPINYVDSISAAVQIHHGVKDGTVPILFSDKLNEAMIKAGKPVEYYAYPDGDHQFNGVSQLALDRMLALFNRTLK